MKRFIYYVALMLLVTISLPLLIVRSCSFKSRELPERKPDVLIRVYVHTEKKVRDMMLEDYLKGVVAAEMPADFGLEALKAQAVAARTYAYSRMFGMTAADDNVHDAADVCTDFTHCQAWISKDAAMKKWGLLTAVKNWNKICKSVEDTRGVILTYNNSVISPVYHSNSGGMTENAEDVWDGSGEPYLTSVVSDGEKDCPGFLNTVSVKISDFCRRLKKEYPDIKLAENNVMGEVDILERTGSGRVKTLKIGNVVLKGTDFRRIFSLKSTNIKIEKNGKDSLLITTIGNGHGVGMSQWGANYLAKKGLKYGEILKYYYKGVELDRIVY